MSLLSIIIPAFNEEKMIEKATNTMLTLMKDENIPVEIIFVNDGSKDATWEEVEKVSRKYSNVKGLCFSRNFGKEAAIFAGLENSCGDCCVVIDCDLQHPPETVVQMYRYWQEGYEVVEGVKASRGQEGKLHGIFVKSFYSLLNKATGFDLSKSSDFKLLDRKVVEAYLKLPERKLFFRALSFWLGFKSVSVRFEVRGRTEGETKWSTISLIKYAIHNITSFSSAPMQVITMIGVVFFLFAVVLAIQSLVNYLSGESLEGFTTVILLLLAIGSLLMVSLGIIGYYVSKIYEEVKRRPRYVISVKTVNEK